jgi:hypothetical protein
MPPSEAGEVEPLIIVGIYNTGDRRLAEYTHERDWQDGRRRGSEYGLTLTREFCPGSRPLSRPHRPRIDGPGRVVAGRLVSLYLGLRYAHMVRQAGRAVAPASGGTTKAFWAT